MRMARSHTENQYSAVSAHSRLSCYKKEKNYQQSRRSKVLVRTAKKEKTRMSRLFAAQKTCEQRKQWNRGLRIADSAFGHNFVGVRVLFFTRAFAAE